MYVVGLCHPEPRCYCDIYTLSKYHSVLSHYIQRQRLCETHYWDLFLILDYERRVNELVQYEPLKLGQIEKLSSQLNTYIIPTNQSKSRRCALIFYNTEDREGAGEEAEELELALKVRPAQL